VGDDVERLAVAGLSDVPLPENPVTVRDFEALAVLADEVLAGEPECLYDRECHEGPADLASEPPAERAAREQVAAEICAACPVREPCLAYALHTRPARGVWAGLTAFEIGALADALILGEEVSGAPATAAKHATGAPVPSQCKETAPSMPGALSPASQRARAGAAS